MTTDSKIAVLDSEAITTKEETPFQLVVRRFRKHKMAMFSLGLITVIFLLSLAAPYITSYTVDELKVGDFFLSFGSTSTDGRVHILGTDHLGRDYFTRLIYAGRISLSVALFAVLISTLIGMTMGAIAGFYGKLIDTLIMRFVELLLTIPDFPLLLILSSMLIQNEDLLPIPEPVLYVAGKVMLLSPFQARSAVLIILVFSALGWLTTAQLMRGMVLQVREQTFVEAARSLGASDISIIFGHMIPNAMAPIIVTASLGMSGYIVGEAALSFLGLGITDPIPTWGNMLSATQQFMLDRPYLPLVPGLPIFICALAFNYVGDGLRDALDPRLKM
jgi:peptide/nickel transport system permease protein